MTVLELLKKLRKCPLNMNVVFDADEYGDVDIMSIEIGNKKTARLGEAERVVRLA